MTRYVVDRALTPEGWCNNALVQIEHGRIQDVVSVTQVPADTQRLNGTLLPGLVDVQVNGGGGVLFNQSPTVATLETMVRAHSQYATTAMLPTLITDDFKVLEAGANAVAQARSEAVPGIAGIHFEGPHLCTEKRGVHPRAKITLPNDDFIDLFSRADLGKVVVTLAPDRVSPETIETLCNRGVIVSLGHSNANVQQVRDAINAGATGFTHLYNAMSPLQSREPGMVGAALADEETYCGLILDHHHVHPTASKLAYRAKGKNKLMLVTDAMALIGTEEGEMAFFDTRIVRHGDKLTTEDGTLAGSHLNLWQAVKNAHFDLNLSLDEAVTMASQTPANFLGLTDHGRLAPGAVANMLLVDDQLQLQRVWLEGLY